MSVSRVILAGVAIAGVLAGCSPVEKSVEPLNAADLTTAVSERLEAEIDIPFTVECLTPLPAEVGASVTCDVTSPAASEGDVTVDVVVTEVDTETGVVSFDLTAQPVIQPTEDSSGDATDEEAPAEESSDDSDS